MSSPELDRPRAAGVVLDLYAATYLLMLLGIAVLVVYVVRLGPLTSPGAEQSFGYAIGLMALMGAVLFHIADRTYRSWPLGRKYTPATPGHVTEAAQVRFLRVLVFVLAAAAVAYLLGGLFT